MPHRNQKGYRARLQSVIKEFEKKTFEREELIRLILLAIFCKQHIFLFGKPGVGKTYIARLATRIFGPDKYWEILMAHDTTTEQLMGSLKKDEHGNTYRDLCDSMLDKPFVFLDEMFKGSNKVLNALLGPMLDRRYTEGGYTTDVPLITLFGASNEFPEGEDIKPFEDRLMFRFDVPRLQDWDNRKAYNNNNFDKTDKFHTHFDMDEIAFVGEKSNDIVFPDMMLNNYIKMQDAILKDGILISDRKFGPDQAGKVFRVCAYLNGRKEVNFSDLMLLSHIAWHNLTDKYKLGEVLYRVMFGSTASIDKELLAIEEKKIRVSGQMDAQCGIALNYTKEYSGQFAGQDFIHDHGYISSYLQEFKAIHQSLMSADKMKIFAFQVQKQCEENIFLFDVKQNSYTEEIIFKMDSLNTEISNVVELLASWVNGNKRYFDYNNNRLMKIAG